MSLYSGQGHKSLVTPRWCWCWLFPVCTDCSLAWHIPIYGDCDSFHTQFLPPPFQLTIRTCPPWLCHPTSDCSILSQYNCCVHVQCHGDECTRRQIISCVTMNICMLSTVNPYKFLQVWGRHIWCPLMLCHNHPFCTWNKLWCVCQTVCKLVPQATASLERKTTGIHPTQIHQY